MNFIYVHTLYFVVTIIAGTISGVVSSLFVSLNSIYTSKLLPIVENDKSKSVLFIQQQYLYDCIVGMHDTS